MLLKEGSVVCQGSYEEIIQTGFNIKDILDSYNKALTAQEGQKNKFKDEKKKTNDASPSPTKLSESEPAKKQSQQHDSAKDLVQAEQKFEDDIGFQDYRNLFSFTIGCWGILLYAAISVITTLLQMAPSYVLVLWSSLTLEEQQKDNTWMLLFVGSIILFMVFGILRSISIQLLMMQATTNMHNTMTEKVIRAKILFFDSNTSGTIISRFSKDVGVLDNLMPILVIVATQGILRTISVVITVAVVNPWIIIPSFIGLFYMLYVTKRGIKPMIESQRFDFLYYGPINQTFTMMISGLVTFRAYRRFDFYREQFLEALESSANSTFCYNMVNRWIGTRLDLVCAFLAICTAAFCVAYKGILSTELLIFSL